MSTRWSLALVTALLVLPSFAAVGSAETGLDRVVERIALDGEILADTGDHRLGPAYSSGPIFTDGEWPNGTLSVPAQATEASWSLSLDRPRSEGNPLELLVCPEACPHTASDEIILRNTTGTRTLELSTNVTSLDSVGWLVRAQEDPVVDTEVRGEVQFLQEPAPDPAPEPASQATPAPTPGTDHPWLRGAITAGLGLTAFAVHARLRRWWPTPLLGLYHRIDDDELLEHPKRQEIHDLVTAEPGIHFSELERRTDLATGNLNHHLHRMVDANLIEEQATSGYRCFFPQGGVSDAVREAADRVRSDTAQRLLAAVSENPQATVSGLADEIPVARSTIYYHLDRLAEADLVHRDEQPSAIRVEVTSLGDRVLEQLNPPDRQG